MKKIVENLERDDQIEPAHSDWAATSLIVPKRMEPIAWFQTIVV